MFSEDLVTKEELLFAADWIREAVQKKVSSGSSLAESCPCHLDILRHWFNEKPRERAAWRLTENDFPKDFFPCGWDTVLNVHGQGQKVIYPIFLRPTVYTSVKQYIRIEQGQVWSARRAATPHASLRCVVEQASC